MKYAVESGFDWVATFDQDSRASDGFFAQTQETYQQAPHPEKIAIIAPSYVDRESGVCRKTVLSGGVLVTMSSGSIIPISIIRSAGTFDESLFMDSVVIDCVFACSGRGS